MAVSEAIRASSEAWAEKRKIVSKSIRGGMGLLLSSLPHTARQLPLHAKHWMEVCFPEGSLDMGTPGAEWRYKAENCY